MDAKLPVHETAKLYIKNNSLNQRVSEINKNSVFLDETLEDLLKTTQMLIKEKKLLSEEVNVLWWLFGEYSELIEKYFNEIEDNTMVIIGPKELYDLSQFKSELPAARHILRKAIKACVGKGEKLTSLKLCIESMNKEDKLKILGSKHNTIDLLTPCLFALKNSNTENWHTSIGFSSENNVNHNDLAMQFYKEIVFINSIY